VQVLWNNRQRLETAQQVEMLHTKSVAILAGGQSRRMGRDKAQLRWGEASWLEHTARVALEVVSHLAVIGRSRPVDWPLGNIAFLEDAVPDSGPMGGLLAALRWASELPQECQVLALACDTPNLKSGAVEWVFEQASQRQLQHGLIVRNGGRVEPLFSIYTVRCLTLLEQRLASDEDSPGRFSLRAFIEAADFEYVDAPATIAAMLHNFNTPDDVRAFGSEGNTCEGSQK
jgi:molybdopterin-guanine dinucleotide biosynthesis protein A